MFVDRQDAGTRLGARLRGSVGAEDVIVLGLVRGGVPVAFEVARALGAPLDVIVVRKLGVPFQPELGFGAIGEGGARVVNRDIVRLANLTRAEMALVEERERAELQRRTQRYRGDRPPVELAGRTVIVVDDGIATGGTARAACQIARARGATRVVLAVPVGTPDKIASLREDADEVICLETPVRLRAIGTWYDDFTQTTDEQLVELLQRAAASENLRDENGTAPTVAAPSTAEGIGSRPGGAATGRNEPEEGITVTTARDIMHQGVECVGEHETLTFAAQRMRELDVGALPICGDDDRLHGIITDRDIVLKCVAAGGDPTTVTAGELAQGKPTTIEADADLRQVLDAMEEHRIRRLPVIDDHRLAGMISEADLARHLPEETVGHFVEIICARS